MVMATWGPGAWLCSSALTSATGFVNTEREEEKYLLLYGETVLQIATGHCLQKSTRDGNTVSCDPTREGNAIFSVKVKMFYSAEVCLGIFSLHRSVQWDIVAHVFSKCGLVYRED